jgi:hypothetical protein
MSKIERTPDAVVEFEHRIRDEWVIVKGHAWGDSNGIYKTRIAGVYLDGVNVTGLLTQYDLDCIDAEIEPAVLGEASDNAAVGHIPGPFPTL